MKRASRLLMALGAFFVLALAIAACGSGLPGDAVATVNGNSISKSDFNHWMTVAAKGQQQQAGATSAAPDPPDYKKCIAALRKSIPTPKKKKGQTTPQISDATLKKQCEQQYQALRSQVLQLLISTQWLDGEAKDLGINVTDAQVKKHLDQIKKQQFPTKDSFDKFLKQSGMTLDDVLFRVRSDLLTTKIRDKITKGGAVTSAQIKAYYDKNKKQYFRPETRDMDVVLAKTEADANAAKSALQGGESIKDVAKQYSTDPQTKNSGGQLKGVAKGQQDKALDDAAFKAPKGKLIGPFKSPNGWYVIRVTKITPGKQMTLKEVTPSIKQLLTAQGQQSKLKKFTDGFQKKWKDKTDCRDGYKVPLCKGEKTPTTQAAPQQAPQQQAPQQAPQQQAPPSNGG